MRRIAVSPSLLALALLALVIGPLQAQIGFQPEDSPFRSITRATWLEVFGGQLLGNGGPIPVGPHDGSLYGARIAFRGKHTTQIGLGFWYADAIRNVVDPFDSVAHRVKGPFPAGTMGIETTLQFNVTGTKNWHRLAPYGSISAGFAFATTQRPAIDTSGYTFGTKTYFGPALGTRYFLSDRVYLKAEARSTLWKMKYPGTFSAEPPRQPGTPAASNAVNPSGRVSDWVMAPKLIFGIAWGF